MPECEPAYARSIEPAGRLGRWANPAAEREFRTLEDALRADAWQQLHDAGLPAAPSELEVETPVATTRAYHLDGAGDPVVLLHGAGTTSLMWVPLLAQLVGRSVYALDTPGDPGRSVQRAPLHDPDDLTRWLRDVLDGLGLGRVQLVGASYGGWMALLFALRGADRVASLTLLEPVLERVRPWFFVHGLACGLAMVAPAPLRRRAARELHMEALGTDDARLRRWGFLGQAKYRRGAPKFVPVTDAQLRTLSVPTLVLVGEKSSVHRSRAVLQRVRTLVPAADAGLVPGAGHALPVDQAEEIGPRVRAFLDRAGARPV
jgi:pimeloyl-ACP methyl ester carboxylesterase